jgi:hypothetical protein
MAWSRVDKPFQKPIVWWYYKLLCEFGYWIEKTFNSVVGMRMYYKYLNRLCDKGYNLHGKKIK